tara:strand:- start:12475 stop:12738 length:264 start_codon:yes stop_codon:yes gene_type:complete
MSGIPQLPNKITNITVCTDYAEVGVLTHGSVHHYQPIQENLHVSLTMTKKGMDVYSSGSLHPIFSQNLPVGHFFTQICMLISITFLS